MDAAHVANISQLRDGMYGLVHTRLRSYGCLPLFTGAGGFAGPPRFLYEFVIAAAKLQSEKSVSNQP